MLDDDQPISRGFTDLRGETRFAGDPPVAVDVNQLQDAFSQFDDQVHRLSSSDTVGFALQVFNLWSSILRRSVTALATITDNQLLYVWNTAQQAGPSPSNPYRGAQYTAHFLNTVLAAGSAPLQNHICVASPNYQIGYWCAGYTPPSISPCEAWCAAAGTQAYCLNGPFGVCPCFFNAHGRVPTSRAEMDAFGDARGLRHGDGSWTYPVGADGCGGQVPHPDPVPTSLYDATGDFNNFCDAARAKIVTALGPMWQNAPCSVIQLFIQDHGGIVGTNDPIRLAAQCVFGHWHGSVPPALGVTCGASTGGGCQSANDCPTGFVCTTGVCTPTGATTGCGSDAQCNPGFLCVNHVCQYQAPAPGTSCGHSGDCPPGLRCCNDQCQATCPAPCASKADCADGQWCNNGSCTGGTADLGGVLATVGAILGIGVAALVIHDHLTKPR